jgi:hypothetical protein
MAMVTTGDNNNSFFLTSCSSFDIMPVKNESLLII